MDLKEADILGEDVASHWYYRSKAKAMTKLLGRVEPTTILDIGAGSGFFSRYLLSNSPAREAWCVDIGYDEDSEAIEAGKPLYFRRYVDRNNAGIVLLMDVLEHVDDDVDLLDNYVRKVPKGARFLISVPAFHFLWSGHDIFLKHKRRYQLEQIEEVTRRAGLTVLRGAYYFVAVFPVAVLLRLRERRTTDGNTSARSQLSRHHPWINNVLTILCGLELPLMKFNRAAGLTAFCLAEKRE